MHHEGHKPAKRIGRSARARVLSVAAGLAIATLGSSIAMAGVLATVYADTGPAAAQAAATMATTQSDRTLSYPLAQVWPTTLRYLRVDLGYALVDRDPEAGYILFDFAVGRPGEGDGRVARGSIEMFSTEDMSGRPAVRLQISTESGPSHLPHTIAEGLSQKLRKERGAPAPPPSGGAPAPPPVAPDDGTPPQIEPPIDP